MDKLTIEQKAKAYNEAIERASKLRVQNPFDTVSQMMEHVFPELAESEDERIRKALVEHFKWNSQQIINEFANKEVLVWLEKKKDNLSIDFVLGYLGIKPAYKDGNAWCILLGDNIQEGICGFGDTKEEALIAFMKELIEKQGMPAKLSEEEQNKFAKVVLTSCALSFINYLNAHKCEGKMWVSNGECEDIKNAFHNAMWDKLHRYYCKYIEKQGEQKSTIVDIMKNYFATTPKEQQDKDWEELKYLNDIGPDIEIAFGAKGGELREKQGEQKSTNSKEDDVRRVSTIQVLEYAKSLPDYNQFGKDAINKNIAWVKKQGNKPQGKSALEAAKEEKVDNQNCVKPVDEVEPKFNVGDWVVVVTSEGEKVVQINSIEYFESGEPRYITSTGKWFGNGTEAHLWTIQDAKAGDVLVCKGNIKNSNGIKYERICLFNNLDEAFFTLTKSSNYVEECDINVKIDYPDNTVPATKKQKEILFMAMTNAGYIFDFEKKELKKIEHKPVWSEDDKKMIDAAIQFAHEYGRHGLWCWLKSLKDRFI